MKLNCTLAFLSYLCCLGLNAQLVADFESIINGPDQALYGQDGVFSHTSGGVVLDITEYGTFDGGFYWFGAAVSSYTGGNSGGLSEQFTAKSGSGVDDSDAYAVTFGERVVLRLTEEVAGGVVEGMHVSNTAFTYFVIRDGNAFSGAFGGETGEDPDFFLLTIKGFSDGALTTDSVDFYLADYRSPNSDLDYIVEDWNYVDLTSLGSVDSLELTLKSSDFNDFGILTPAYVAIDNVITSPPSAVVDPQRYADVKLYPNPSQGQFQLTSTEGLIGGYQLYNLVGQQIQSGQINGQFDFSYLPAGSYQLLLQTKEGWLPRRLLKQ